MGLKSCPYCNEEIQFAAKKCRFCGEWLDENISKTQKINQSYLNIQNTIVESLQADYEMLGEIGRGGMATVYKAIQKNIDKLVALKVVHNSLIHDDDFLLRFEREAKLSASLRHYHIIDIYDIKLSKDLNYISMEYLDGEDLHSKIKKNGKLSLDSTINYLTPIFDALNYAHDKDIIHRDVKSSNIIITNDGRPVLTDFGIAYANSSTKLTKTGTLIGTPEYMSPEQAEGLPTDHKSDLYSLGVVMYECLTGDVPFNGNNPISVIRKIIDTPPSNPESSTILPRWISQLVMSLLEKDPSRRPRNGIEVLKYLNSRSFNLQINNINKNDKVINDRHTVKKTRYSELRKNHANPKKNNFSKTSFTTSNYGYESLLSDFFKNFKLRSNKLILYAISTVGLTIIILLLFYLFSDSFSGGYTATKSEEISIIKPDGTKNIDQLYSKAIDLIRENKLTTPKGENAYEIAKKIIEIDKNNIMGKRLLSKIVSKYEVLGDKYMKGEIISPDDISKARSFYNKSLSIKFNSRIKDKIDYLKQFRFTANQKAISPNDKPKAKIISDNNVTISPTIQKDEGEISVDFFMAVEEMPQPIGGIAAIQKRIVYPEIAQRAGVQGRVFVKAFVDEYGRVHKAEIVKGIGAGCDEAAIAAVLKTKFKPGKQRGKHVRVQVSVPILFKLN